MQGYIHKITDRKQWDDDMVSQNLSCATLEWMLFLGNRNEYSECLYLANRATDVIWDTVLAMYIPYLQDHLPYSMRKSFLNRSTSRRSYQQDTNLLKMNVKQLLCRVRRLISKACSCRTWYQYLFARRTLQFDFKSQLTKATQMVQAVSEYAR